MGAEDFWSDQDHAKRVSKQAADLRTELETWESVQTSLGELLELSQLEDEELQKEISEKVALLEKQFATMEFATLFNGDYDKDPAILSIHAGSGGTEAQDWTQMLLRMFLRFAEDKDWEVKVLNESRAQDVGLKSVTIRIDGRWAYGYFKSEHGVHRLVRISPFDA